MTLAEDKPIHVEVRPVNRPQPGARYAVPSRQSSGLLTRVSFVLLGLIASVVAGLFLIVMLIVGSLAGIISMILSPMRKK